METSTLHQATAGIAFALGLGLVELRCEVMALLILNLSGNVITLSNEFKPAEIGKGEGLKSYLTRSWKKDRPFTMPDVTWGSLSRIYREVCSTPPPSGAKEHDSTSFQR